jgi:hypothetical protein
MGRAFDLLDKVLIDESLVGPAVERRQMGMEDEVASDVLNLEFAHVIVEKPDHPGAGFENLRV